jgi:hypothetical protein
VTAARVPVTDSDVTLFARPHRNDAYDRCDEGNDYECDHPSTTCANRDVTSLCLFASCRKHRFEVLAIEPVSVLALVRPVGGLLLKGPDNSVKSAFEARDWYRSAFSHA